MRKPMRRALGIAFVLAALLTICPRPSAAEIVPFMIDAEIEIYLTDLSARVVSPGGPVAVWEPGIREVRVDGKALPVLKRAPNLLVVDMPKGRAIVEIVATGTFAATTPTSSPHAPAISSREEFIERAKTIGPGEEIVIRNGAYPSWHVELAAKGTPDKPIVIRPETPGGVLFYHAGKTASDSYAFHAGLRLTGRHILVKHLRFSHTRRFTIQIDGGSDNRVTQCHFLRCGSAVSPFGHVANVGLNSHRNRFDHNYFTGSKSMSLGQSIPADQAQCGQDNRFDRNIFRDIERVWLNGQEAVQIGGGGAPLTVARCTVEYNLFDNCSGDLEIISNKSSGNRLNYNLFVRCKGSLYFRNGNNGEAIGNVLLGGVNGLSVRGKGHRILNNLIVRPREAGILLASGSPSKPIRSGPAADCLIAHNTIVDPGTTGISGGNATGSRPTLPPSGNRILNNIVTAEKGTLLAIGVPEKNEIGANLLGARENAELGAAGPGTLKADPNLEGNGILTRAASNGPAKGKAKPLNDVPLDRWQRKRTGKTTDMGADLLSVPPATSPSDRFLPLMPDARPAEPQAADGTPLYAMNADAPLEGWRIEGQAMAIDGGFLLRDGAVAKLETEIPENFVLEWEYRPELFASKAALAILGNKDEQAYRLAFGGARNQRGKADKKLYENIPAGVVSLQKGAPGIPVATAMDTLYTFMNFYPTWPGNTIKLRHKEPPREWWYQCRLTRKNGMMRLMMNNLNATTDGHWIPKSGVRKMYPTAGQTPVLIWEDTGEIGGPPLDSGTLRIEQTVGGTWRKVSVRKCR